MEHSLRGRSYGIGKLRLILYTWLVKRPDWMRISMEYKGCTVPRAAIPLNSKASIIAHSVGVRLRRQRISGQQRAPHSQTLATRHRASNRSRLSRLICRLHHKARILPMLLMLSQGNPVCIRPRPAVTGSHMANLRRRAIPRRVGTFKQAIRRWDTSSHPM